MRNYLSPRNGLTVKASNHRDKCIAVGKLCALHSHLAYNGLKKIQARRDTYFD